MPKTKVQPKKDEVSEEEKIIEPDLVVPALLDEDSPEESDDESAFDKEELDPFGDKYEE